jgi:hypothetical protein
MEMSVPMTTTAVAAAALRAAGVGMRMSQE